MNHTHIPCVRQLVFERGEERGPGGAGVGHRPPLGTRCFDSSNQLRTTLMRGVGLPASPPPKSLRIGGVLLRQNLDRHLATQAGVLTEVHLAHTASA